MTQPFGPVEGRLEAKAAAKVALDLSFPRLMEQLRKVIPDFPDQRTGANCHYSMEDAALGAFAVFFTQSPSFLAHQKSLEETKGQNNARSLFGIQQIPCDVHIRNLLDGVAPANIVPVFSYIFDALKRAGALSSFLSCFGGLLIALDGTYYFSSKKLHCQNCSTRQHQNGSTTYFHSVLTPVVVAPGQDKVIALEPEFILPQDGHDKQDCESAAGKRWLNQYGTRYSPLGITILGDDLYCHQPMCQQILEAGCHFLLTCKPDSHPTLYEWLEGLESCGGIGVLTVQHWAGKKSQIDTYRYAEQVPLRDGADGLLVNWCELTSTDQDGKTLYHNAFATDHPISESNVQACVAAGRARWKVENENNNTLKTKGYHLEHNYGHGQKELAALLATFNILAFLIHTVLELMDKKYGLIRSKLPSRQTFFDDVRALTRYLYFASWDGLLEFMMQGLELELAEGR